MGAELGATTSVFPYDERMARYLRATRRGDIAELADRYRHMLTADPECEANPSQYYDQVVEINLSELEPHLVGPHSPDRARPISRMAAELETGFRPDRHNFGGADRQLHQLVLRGHESLG